MKNKKSTYYTLFRFSYITAAICIMLIGTAVTMLSSELFKKEKFNEIVSISDTFIGITKDDFERTGNIHSETITDAYKTFMKKHDIVFYVYDKYGNCVLQPDDKSDAVQLSANIIERIDEEAFLDFDAKKISDKEPSILYGDRFSVKYGNRERQRLYLTAYSPTDSINAFNIKLILTICLLGIILLIFAYKIMHGQASKYTEDAEEFRRVSEKYSKGDFSEKIEIKNAGTLQDISKYVNSLADNSANSENTSKTFIANVSHELRTPITTIGGFVDGILDGTISKTHQQEYLILVSKEIKRLRILISSMLNMTKYESGTLTPNFKQTNLTELVIQTVLMFEKKIDDKEIEIEGLDSERLMVVADPDLIQQVIYNLVENAVKFVNHKGTISFIFEKNRDICTVGIRNTGEGLKNEEIQQVFDRFYKTDASRGKDATGLGLGLSISRKIVQLHKGRIVVKSVYGEYTEFSVQLPKKQEQGKD